MKNREKWAKEIIDIALSGDRMGIVKGEPVACPGVDCRTCDIYAICAEDPEAEAAFRREWAEAEAKDKETSADKLRRKLVKHWVWRVQVGKNRR